MPHHRFRFSGQPPATQPVPEQKRITEQEVHDLRPKIVPVAEQEEPIRVQPSPRMRTDPVSGTKRLEPVPGALSMMPKASLIPRTSLHAWQPSSPEAE